MYYLLFCMENAVNNPNECGYEFNYLWDIRKWVYNEYVKGK